MSNFWIACHACGKREGLKTCIQCQSAYYCSQECQQQCWEHGVHSLVCSTSITTLPVGQTMENQGKDDGKDPIGYFLNTFILGHSLDRQLTFEQLANLYYDASHLVVEEDDEIYTVKSLSNKTLVQSIQRLWEPVWGESYPNESEFQEQGLADWFVNLVRPSNISIITLMSNLMRMFGFAINYDNSKYYTIVAILSRSNVTGELFSNQHPSVSHEQQKAFATKVNQVKSRQTILVNYTEFQRTLAYRLLYDHCQKFGLVMDSITPSSELLLNLLRRYWAELIYECLPDNYKKSMDSMEMENSEPNIMDPTDPNQKKRKMETSSVLGQKRSRQISEEDQQKQNKEYEERDRLIEELKIGRDVLKQQDTRFIYLPIEILLLILSPEKEIGFLDVQRLRQTNLYIMREENTQRRDNYMGRFFFMESFWYAMCKRDFYFPLMFTSPKGAERMFSKFNTMLNLVSSPYGDIFYTFYLDQMKSTTQAIMQRCEMSLFPNVNGIHLTTLYDSTVKTEMTLDIMALSKGFTHYTNYDNTGAWDGLYPIHSATVHLINQNTGHVALSLHGQEDSNWLSSLNVLENAQRPMNDDDDENQRQLFVDPNVLYNPTLQYHDSHGKRHNTVAFGPKLFELRSNAFTFAENSQFGYDIRILYSPFSFYYLDGMPDRAYSDTDGFSEEYHQFFHYFYRRALAYCVCLLIDATPQIQKAFLQERFHLDSDLFFEHIETNEIIPGGVLTLSKTRPKFTFNKCTRYEIEGHIMSLLMMLDMQEKLIYPDMGILTEVLSMFHTIYFHTRDENGFNIEGNPIHFERYRALTKDEADLATTEKAGLDAVMKGVNYLESTLHFTNLPNVRRNKLDWYSAVMFVHPERDFIYDESILKTPLHEAYARFNVENIVSTPHDMVNGTVTFSPIEAKIKGKSKQHIVQIQDILLKNIPTHQHTLYLTRLIYQTLPNRITIEQDFLSIAPNQVISFSKSFYESLARVMGTIIAVYPQATAVSNIMLPFGHKIIIPKRLITLFNPNYKQTLLTPLVILNNKAKSLTENKYSNLQSFMDEFVQYLTPYKTIEDLQQTLDEVLKTNAIYKDTIPSIQFLSDSEKSALYLFNIFENMQSVKIDKSVGHFYHDIWTLPFVFHMNLQLKILGQKYPVAENTMFHDIIKPSEVKHYDYYLGMIRSMLDPKIIASLFGIPDYFFNTWDILTEHVNKQLSNRKPDRFHINDHIHDEYAFVDADQEILLTTDIIFKHFYMAMNLLYTFMSIVPNLLTQDPAHPLRFIQYYTETFKKGHDIMVPWYKTEFMTTVFKIVKEIHG